MSKSKSNVINAEALSRIDSRDMLILQDTAGRVMSDLTRFQQVSAQEGSVLEVASRENLEAVYGFGPGDEDERKPFVYQDGVAVIPVHGTLLNRFNGSWGFVTGFQYIRRMMNAALDDDDVEQIVFDVDSPGGEAAGCFELAREIMASRRVKPSLAMVDSIAASGGIAIAACATTVYAIPSARVGSIGVYRMHVSYEDALKQAGIKVTFAQAGDHKTEGNPYKDLPDAVLNEWTDGARKTWDDFISLVAEARDISEDEVRETQARIYRADEALAKGLINAVKTPTEAVAAFLAELADDDPSNDDEEEEIEMADVKGKEVTSGLTASDLASIKSMVIEASVAAVSTLSASMQRASSIKDYAASKGKQFAALASTLAADESVSLESATAIIDAAAGGVVAAPAAKPKKSKGQRAADPEDDEDGDEDGDDTDNEDGDDGDDNDDGDDDGEEQSRSRRSRGRDNVNHFERAMKGKSKGVGGGKVKGEEDGEQGSGKKGGNRLLAAHASVTGADWSSKALKH